MAIIRERTTLDLEGCAESLRAVYKVSGYPVEGVADAIGFIMSPGTIQAWVAEYENRVVGHIAITTASLDHPDVALWREQGHTDDVACLGRLFVHPEAQGLGIGAKLMTAAVEYAANRSERLVLFAFEKDKIARRMYAQLGWTFYGNFEYKWDKDSSMIAQCFVSPALTK